MKKLIMRWKKRRLKSPNLLGSCINNTMNGKKVVRRETKL